MTVPYIIYGTAWKEDATAALTRKAVIAGFRGIDTANQKKHYRMIRAGTEALPLMASRRKRLRLWRGNANDNNF